MPIICFFGPDGAGKTTLATTFREYLRAKGLKTKIGWMRGTHTFASLLAMLISRFKTFRGKINPYHDISIPRRYRRFWQFIEIVSVLPIVIVRFIIPNFLGYYVIADRYLPDFLVWVSLTTEDDEYLNKLESKILISLTLKSKARIYLTAPLDVLMKRGHTDSLPIKKQIELYTKLAKLVNAKTIDTGTCNEKDCLKQLSSLSF